jgi:DNA-directed RNA polymerase specialized sigma24 family protein
MASMMYTVRVSREGSAWLASVDEMVGVQTYARNLVALDREVREALGVYLDVENEVGFEFDYIYENIDEETARAVEIGQQRMAIEREQARLALEAAREIVILERKGFSVRDISGILRMSPGRVSQIARERGSPRSPERESA